MNFVEIIRPISGLDAKRGDVVDASDWPAVRELERQGYIRHCTPTVTPLVTTAAEQRTKGGRHAQ